MHFYNFNPADFNNSARHLTLVERAIYRDLIDMYYHNEKPIDGSNMALLERQLLCRSDDEKQALQNVLSEFFIKKGNKYHNRRIDRAIKKYRYSNRNENITQTVTDSNASSNDTVTQSNETSNEYNDEISEPLSNAERQKKLRDERKQMTESLINNGVGVDKNIGMPELRQLYKQHCHNENITQTVTDSNEVVTQSNEVCNESNDKNRAITNNYKLITNNYKLITNNYKKEKNKESVTVIFEFWKQTFGKNSKTLLSDTRKRKIEQRLTDGYSVDEIKTAIVNCSKSEFHVSQNYTDIELICRSVEKLDQFIGMNNHQANKSNTQGQNYANNQSNLRQFNNQPRKSDAEIMHERNMAEYNQWVAELATREGRPTSDGVNIRDVYPMETAVPN